MHRVPLMKLCWTPLTTFEAERGISRTMAGSKQPVSFDVQDDVLEMLDEAAAKYNMPTRDKALRAVMDYVAMDGNWDEIFGKLRCIRCGGRPGWTPSAEK